MPWDSWQRQVNVKASEVVWRRSRDGLYITLTSCPDYEEMNVFFRIFRIFNLGYLCVLTFQRTAKGAGHAAAGSPVSEGHLQSSV